MVEFLVDAGDDRQSTIPSLSCSPRRIVNNTFGNRHSEDVIIKAREIFCNQVDVTVTFEPVGKTERGLCAEINE